MNELRWTLLIIGIIIIAGIYFWESRKRKHRLRSKIDNLPAHHDEEGGLHLNPRKDKNIDITGALAAFNAYLKQSRSSARAVAAPIRIETDNAHGIDEIAMPEIDAAAPVDDKEPAADQQVITLYITAHATRRFSGADIIQAVESSDMQFGDMNIFHYFGPDKKHATRALFSLANIHEPGYFDLNKMDTFTTRGLVLFMCLPAEIGGDIAFEIMHDTAHNLAYLLEGEIRGADRTIIGAEQLAALREIASRY